MLADNGSDESRLRLFFSEGVLMLCYDDIPIVKLPAFIIVIEC